MILIIGLGPIGSSIGEHLAELGRDVAGLDLDAGRRSSWERATGRTTYATADAITWESVSAIIIAVRLADQVRAVLAELSDRSGADGRTVVVVTTLSIQDARQIFSEPHKGRLFEAPLSGGPAGARDGSMTLFVAGPAASSSEEVLFSEIAGRVVRVDGHGGPAGVKLFNNTLGAYNALATASIVRVASQHGLSPTALLDAVRTSSGQSWMSDNFREFHDDLLFKDVHLLMSDIGELPAISFTPTIAGMSRVIENARQILETSGTERS